MGLYMAKTADRAVFYQRVWSEVMLAAARDLTDIQAGHAWRPSTMDRYRHMTEAHLAIAIHIIAGMAEDLGSTVEDLRFDSLRPEIEEAMAVVCHTPIGE